MPRSILSIVASLVLASCTLAQGPQLKSVFPPGLQQGTTAEIALTGTNLNEIKGFYFSHKGLSGRVAQGTRCAITATADVPEGEYDCWLVTPVGLSNPQRLAIGGFPEINEKEPNNLAEAAQDLKLPVVVNGALTPGTDRDYYRFDLTRGQRLTVRWQAETLGSNIRPALTLYGPRGEELLHDRGREIEPTLDYLAQEAGRYLVRVEERAYRADPLNSYRLAFFTGPRLVAAFPPVLTRGKAQPVTLYGYNLPGGTTAGDSFPPGLQQLQASVTASALGDLDAGGWTLSNGAFLEGFRYRHPGVSGTLRFGLVEREVTLEAPKAHATMATAQPVPFPCEIVGRFLQPREVDWYRFSAKKGQVLWIETIGERDGKTMDLDIAIHSTPEAAPEPFADTAHPKEQPTPCPLATFDPMGVFKVPADGEYHVVVRDLYGTLAGVERTYRLSLGPRREEVRVVALQSPTVTQGGTASLPLIAIRRGGHEGAIRVRAENLPPGLEVKEVVIAAKQFTGSLTLTAAKDAPAWVGKLSLVAETEIDGKPQTLSVVPLTTVREGATPLVRRCEGLVGAITGKP